MTKAVVVLVAESMNDLKSSDKDRQNQAFQALLEMTDERVDWTYEVWDDLLRLTAKGDNLQRSIAGQSLSNLAKSDPEARIVRDAERLNAVTRGERFVTARHVLLSLGKIAIVGDRQCKAIVDGLVRRFKECSGEKNCTLIRYDIQRVFKEIHEATADQSLRSIAEQLISLEEDAKYRKKYATVWSSAAPSGGSTK
jgi:hypothetical protein